MTVGDDLVIRRIEPADLDALLPLNNALAPHVGLVDAARMADLVAWAELALAATVGDDLAGGMVAIGPGTAYDSPNYRWFSDRYADFLYVDRVFVAPGHHGRGIGRRLYRPVMERAGARGAPVTCEVNERPPNPGSVAFHRRLGFTKIGSQDYDGGVKRVAMMATEPAGLRGVDPPAVAV